MMSDGLDELIQYVRAIPMYLQGRPRNGDDPAEIKTYTWIEETVRELVRRVKFYDDGQARQARAYLAHYTSWKNAIAIVNQDKPVMRMYSYEQANDPLEGCVRPLEWTKVRDDATWLKEYENIGTAGADPFSVFGYSFSSGDTASIGDDLMYWRLYGNNGDGCSFMMLTVPSDMCKVRYRRRDGKPNGNADEDDEDKEVARRMRSLLNACEHAVESVDDDHRSGIGGIVAAAAIRVLDGYRYLVKDEAYRGENEWRRVEINPSLQRVRHEVDATRVRRYVDGPPIGNLLLSGSEITIGPTVHSRYATRSYVEKMIRERRIVSPMVKVSAKSYRRRTT